jgi:hypothetical protein
MDSVLEIFDRFALLRGRRLLENRPGGLDLFTKPVFNGLTI